MNNINGTGTKFPDKVQDITDTRDYTNIVVEYKHLKKTLHATLKFAKNENNNIIYEYLVGDYINRLHIFLPCFIQTHHIFNNEVATNQDFTKFLSHKYDNMIYYDELVDCINNAKAINLNTVLMKEHVFNSINMEKYILENRQTDYSEMYVLLFQLYICLAYLDDTYTHNRLNLTNIILDKLPEKKYMKIKYYLPDKTKIIIKTKHVLKIINYEKSYFYRNTLCNSMIVNNIATTHESIVDDISLVNNKSQDLLAACIIKGKKIIDLPEIHFDVKIDQTNTESIYHTSCAEYMDKKEDNTIYTVVDMYLFLKCKLSSQKYNFIQNNDICIGTLKICMNGQETPKEIRRNKKMQ